MWLSRFSPDITNAHATCLTIGNKNRKASQIQVIYRGMNKFGKNLKAYVFQISNTLREVTIHVMH